MKTFLIVEDLLTLNVLLYDTDTVDGKIVGEIARGNLLKYEYAVRLLGHSNHICFVSITFASF